MTPRWTAIGGALVGALVAAAAIPSPSAAQTISDGRVWWIVSAQERPDTDSPWRWFAEIQKRRRDGVDALDQLVVRGAIGAM